MPTLAERARRVRCVVFDVDGVLTDCKLYLGPDGLELKAVNVRDGLGIKLLLQAGIEVAIISGRPSPAMQARFEYLGVKHVCWMSKKRCRRMKPCCASSESTIPRPR